jgi:hypothetical protein
VYGTKCVASKNGMKIGPDGQPQEGPEEDCKKGGPVPLPKKPEVVPEEGEMIELLDNHNRWVPAIVKKVDEAEVTAEFTNIPGESITQEWPAGSMRYLPTRLCS